MLEKGGNRKFLEFIKMYNIKNNKENRDVKFLTKAMEYYRKKLHEAAL